MKWSNMLTHTATYNGKVKDTSNEKEYCHDTECRKIGTVKH